MKQKPHIKIGIYEGSGLASGSVMSVNVSNRLVKGRTGLLAVYLAKYLKEKLEEVLKEAK